MRLKKTIRIALVSLKTVYRDPKAAGPRKAGEIAANLERHRYWLEKALAAEPDFVGFSEFSLTGWVFNRKAALSLDSEPVREIEALARKHRIFIGAGLVESAGRLLYNTCLIAGPRGRVGVTHKTNLVGLGNRYYTSGSEFPVFDVAGCRMGVAICADASQYAMIQILSLRGAEVVFAPHANVLKPYGNTRSGWLRWRRGIWPRMAQDSCVCLAGVSRAGLFDRPPSGEEAYKYCGGAGVMNARGEFIATLGGANKREGLLVAEVDLAELRAERKQKLSDIFRPDLVYNRPRSWWRVGNFRKPKP